LKYRYKGVTPFKLVVRNQRQVLRHGDTVELPGDITLTRRLRAVLEPVEED